METILYFGKIGIRIDPEKVDIDEISNLQKAAVMMGGRLNPEIQRLHLLRAKYDKQFLKEAQIMQGTHPGHFFTFIYNTKHTLDDNPDTASIVVLAESILVAELISATNAVYLDVDDITCEYLRGLRGIVPLTSCICNTYAYLVNKIPQLICQIKGKVAKRFLKK